MCNNHTLCQLNVRERFNETLCHRSEKITSAHDHLLHHRHAFCHSVVNKFDADRPVVLVKEDSRCRRIQHYMEIRSVPGGAQKSARRGQSRAVSGRGLRYGESGVRPSVQIDRVISCNIDGEKLKARVIQPS